MASSKKNKIIANEESKGFEPSDSDDDFLLDKINQYPGVLPDFNSNPELKINHLNEPESSEDSLKFDDTKQPLESKQEKINNNAVIIEPKKINIKEELKHKKQLSWKRIGLIAFILLALGALGYGAYILFFDNGLLEKINKKEPNFEMSQEESLNSFSNSQKSTNSVNNENFKQPETSDQLSYNPSNVNSPKNDEIIKIVPNLKQMDKYENNTKLHSLPKNLREKNIIASNEKIPITKFEKSIYTIEVYASPSLDDANEWLNLLRKKNIFDGFIKTQKIRDVTWYRVRFGYYDTREDALKVARDLGLSQVWVDRVR